LDVPGGYAKWGQVDSQEWDQRYAGRELVWTAEPNRFVVAELQDLAPGRALDLGAGEGRNAIWLASRGWQATAVDFSAVGLDKGRRLAENQCVAVDWMCADVRGYQPEADSFQLVLVAYLQLREAELDGVLRRAVTALAPGGTLLVVGHDVANLTEGTGGPQEPAVLHTPESVARSLGGLTVVRADRVGRPVAGSARDAVDTLVRAFRPVAVGQ
jgi:SAM-dependent methyltransferase